MDMVIITAAKEEISWRSRKADEVHLGRRSVMDGSRESKIYSYFMLVTYLSYITYSYKVTHISSLK